MVCFTVSDTANLKIIGHAESILCSNHPIPRVRVSMRQDRKHKLRGRGGMSLRRTEQVVFALPSVD
jgi:hypothetical protein